MAIDKRRKTVTYKMVSFTTKGEKLKPRLDAALKKFRQMKHRMQDLAGEGEKPIWRLAGLEKIESGITFSTLLQYVPGSKPRLLIDDPEATRIQIEQFATPKTDSGKRREPMEGLLYFAVTDNHLVLLQSSGLRSSHLEAYLTWLLRKAAVLEETNVLRLNDQPPPAVAKKMMNRAVKSLDVGGDLLPVSSFPTANSVLVPALAETTKTKTLVTTLSATKDGVYEFIKGIVGPDKAAKFDTEALAGSNIEYSLHVTYKGKTTDNGQRLMNTLAAAFRHADDVDTTISLVGGGKITGDEIRLSGPVVLDFYDGAPSTDEVYEAMRTWLMEKLTSKEVKG